jgi:hypothetical protein
MPLQENTRRTQGDALASLNRKIDHLELKYKII